VSAQLDGKAYQMGGNALLKSENIELPKPLKDAADQASKNAQTAIFLIRDRQAIATFIVADAVRPESREAIESLHQQGLNVAILTGDAQAVADSVAQQLGIDTVIAEVRPEDKAKQIEALQAKGQRVAMVGDGVNDAPALATADVGIAIGAGTDVAVEAGHIVLVRSDPRDIPKITRLSQRTYRKMVQNLWWAAGYNIVAIPLAAGVLMKWDLLLSPAAGAILMSMSTVIVAINAQLMKRQPL
jgi:Cu2+-exporting ATPase